MRKQISSHVVDTSYSALPGSRAILVVVPKWIFLRSALTLAVIVTGFIGARNRSTGTRETGPR
ncbi:MAG: hypothetical protein PXZ08_07940 [Actinomycetota bacterium]|nr:hypothetical protein [Actinomycetota bacterium]